MLFSPSAARLLGYLLRRLLTSAASRDASLQGALRGLMGLGLFVRLRSGSSIPRLVRLGYGTTGPSLPSAPHRQGAQISPGKSANCRCTSAAFTVGCVPVGFAAMCQLASHPWALYAVSVRRLTPLALRLPPDNPSRFRPCLRLVVILALMTSPSRYSHRGLAPHKFAPMLGAHHSLKRNANSAARRPSSAGPSAHFALAVQRSTLLASA